MANRRRELTQTERNGLRARNGQRVNRGQFRTQADTPTISTRQLQTLNARRSGRSADYQNYGVQNNGQSIRGRRAEGINPRTGNAVAGREHNARYRNIRRAMGLSAG